MSSFRYWKLGSALATSGLVTVTLTKRTILLDEGDDADDTAFGKAFRSFKDNFNWSRIEHEEKKPELVKPSGEQDLMISNLRMRQEYQAPKYPIVLCHGLSGFDKLILIPSVSLLNGLITGKAKTDNFILEDKGGVSLEYWFGIKEALEQKGSTVLVAKVPGFGSIEDRAEELNKFITQQVEKTRKQSKDDVYNTDNQSKKTFKEKDEKVKVNLIAHSMGGLDSRYLISKLEKSNYEVVSLTTVTTPHRGSEMADYVVNLAKAIPREPPLPPSIYQLTTSYLKKFNEEVQDDPNVLYFSYGACFKPQWYNVFYGSWNIINKDGGANDGIVSVKSAKWGTYLGTLRNVDHLDLINWTNTFKRALSSVSKTDHEEIDSVALYLDIADNLAKRGL